MTKNRQFLTSAVRFLAVAVPGFFVISAAFEWANQFTGWTHVMLSVLTSSLYVLVAFLFVVMLRKWDKLEMPAMRLSMRDLLKGVFIAAFLVIVSIAFTAVFAHSSQPFLWPPHRSLGTSIVLMLLAAWLTLCNAMTEEFILRGYILSLVNRWKGGAMAVLFSSIVFALMHMEGSHPQIEVSMFMFGVLLSLQVLRGHSLSWTVGFHTAWNYLFLYVLGFPMYGSQTVLFIQPSGSMAKLLGGSAGPENSFVVIALLTLSVLAILFSWSRNIKWLGKNSTSA